MGHGRAGGYALGRAYGTGRRRRVWAATAVPVVGPVAHLLVVLLGLGAVVLAGWGLRVRRGGAAVAEVPAPRAEPLPASPVAVRPAA